MGLDHATRAFLALTVALRYEADPGAAFLATARTLLDPGLVARATVLGAALRLACILSAGTPGLLGDAALRLEPGRLVLALRGAGVMAADGAERRLDRLAAALGVQGVVG